MKIGLDFDGVIMDYGAFKAIVIEKMFNIYVPPEKITHEILTKENILTTQQYRTFQETIYGDMEVISSMPPVKNAVSYIHKIMEKHEAMIITSRSGMGLQIAQKWLKKHNLFLPSFGVGYTNEKTPLIKEKGIEIFIDDDPLKLEPLIGTVSDLFLFSWVYNEKVTLSTSITRIRSWKEVCQKIEQKS